MKKETYRCRIQILNLRNPMLLIIVDGLILSACRRVRSCCCRVGHQNCDRMVQFCRRPLDSTAILSMNSWLVRCRTYFFMMFVLQDYISLFAETSLFCYLFTNFLDFEKS